MKPWSGVRVPRYVAVEKVIVAGYLSAHGSVVSFVHTPTRPSVRAASLASHMDYLPFTMAAATIQIMLSTPFRRPGGRGRVRVPRVPGGEWSCRARVRGLGRGCGALCPLLRHPGISVQPVRAP